MVSVNILRTCERSAATPILSESMRRIPWPPPGIV